MKQVNYSQVKITGGFWKERLDLVRRVTVGAVYNRFLETGRFDAFKCDPNAPIKPHIYWDSDVAKWIEGVAYLTREKREPELEKIVDELSSLGYNGGKISIGHCVNEAGAEALSSLILTKYPDADIEIHKLMGLCSFYAERGGILVGFEKA